MNLLDVVLNWKSISTMYDRMESEYKLITKVREYLECECDCMEPVEGLDIRERDYKRLLDAPKVIERYKVRTKKLMEENKNLRFMNAELVTLCVFPDQESITRECKELDTQCQK